MIHVTQERSGTLIRVQAAFTDAALLPTVQAAFRAVTSRCTTQDSMVQFTYCKGGEAAGLVAALAAIRAPQQAVASPVTQPETRRDRNGHAWHDHISDDA